MTDQNAEDNFPIKFTPAEIAKAAEQDRAWRNATLYASMLVHDDRLIALGTDPKERLDQEARIQTNKNLEEAAEIAGKSPDYFLSEAQNRQEEHRSMRNGGGNVQSAGFWGH